MAAIKSVFKKLLWVIFKAGEVECFFEMIICLLLVPWKLGMTLFGLSPFDDTLFVFFENLVICFLLNCSLRWICKQMIYLLDEGIVDAMFGGM